MLAGASECEWSGVWSRVPGAYGLYSSACSAASFRGFWSGLWAEQQFGVSYRGWIVILEQTKQLLDT